MYKQIMTAVLKEDRESTKREETESNNSSIKESLVLMKKLTRKLSSTDLDGDDEVFDEKLSIVKKQIKSVQDLNWSWKF